MDGRVKTRVCALAVFGGTPAFPESLHVGRPNIGSRHQLLARIEALLDRNWLTNDGPFVQEFEARVAEALGVQHCVAVCNATTALEIAIKASGLTGEVIVPSFTFVAAAHALRWLGLDPVFADVDPQSHTLDPRQVEHVITPRTSAIIGVHLWGRPCAVSELSALANHYGLRLLFDAAHAFSCSYQGRQIGNFGNAEVLSFHATKFVNAFEGGAIVTNDAELSAKARLMRNFGFADLDRVVSDGINAKMSEPSAAMGLTSLESVETFRVVNKAHYQHYREELAGISGIELVEYDESEQCNYQYIVVEIDHAAVGLNRDQVQHVLWQEGVLARRYFYPGCHRMEPYRSLDPEVARRLPHTESLAARVLQLPTGTAVDASDISQVCELIRFIVTHSDEIGACMRIAAQSGPEHRTGRRSP